MQRKIIVIPILFLLLGTASLAQTSLQEPVFPQSLLVPKDSIDKHKKHYNPRRAVIESALLPGLGQIDNGQWWKVPILYAGFAACIYSIDFANKNYVDFRDAYVWRNDGDSLTIDKYDPFRGSDPVKYSSDQLKSARDYYRRNLELSVIITAGVYLLNIVDAYVSAHLRNFDISDNLSLQLQAPQLIQVNNKPILLYGFSLTF